MYFLIPLIITQIGMGIYYYKNRKYINIKLFNKSSELILYTKKNIISKCINNKFYITDSILINNGKRINIYYYLFYKILSNNIKNNKNKSFSKEQFDIILDNYNIKKNNDTRILIKYKLNNKNYIIYWTGNNLKNPIVSNEYITSLKNRYYLKSNKESVYMLLIIDMKNINSIKLNKFKIENNNDLFNIFNMLKGPLNDYGYIFNSNIKHKWIYDDFNIPKQLITIEQGYKINEFFNLESYKHVIDYDENYLTFDVFKLL